MAYIERDDRDLDFNQQSDIYDDDSVYDDMYEAENFGERVDSSNDDGAAELESEEDVVVTETDDESTEDGFGETVSRDAQEGGNEVETPQSSADDNGSENAKKDGLFTKAKEKLDEWTEKDQRE